MVPGKSPQYIAKAAGFDIPEDVTILAAECKGRSARTNRSPWRSSAPVRAVLKSEKQGTGLEMCEAMLKHGAGHTAAYPHQRSGPVPNAASVYACCII